MTYEINSKLFAKSHCLSEASLGFLDFLLLLFLYQDKKSKDYAKGNIVILKQTKYNF